jgi:V8-like Glu-specific endopeptidase
MRVQLLLGSLVVAGCGVAEVPAVETPASASERSEIVGGVTDNGDPATVALVVTQGGQYEQFCTGTLVAPKTVVTAAHCINAYGSQYTYAVNFGTYASSPTRSIKVASQKAHPQYTSNGQAHDFGVIQLLTAVTDVTPIAMNHAPLSQADVGKTIRHAGFGVTSGAQNGAGTKRQVTYQVRQVSSALIESGASGKQTCNGDSGGPAFMVMPGGSDEKLVGVVSFGDQNCSMFGEDGRVDVDVAWIEQTMAPWEAPTCATDGKCVAGCTPVDQDCACASDGACSADCADLSKDPDCPADCATNGVCALQVCPRPDSDCVPEGGGCATAIVCHGRQCVSDEQHGAQKYCSVGCGAGAVCPTGMECSAAQVCVLKQKPVVQPGQPCTAATDFCTGANKLCTGPTEGITRCVSGCTTASDCPAGNSCEGGADSRRFCRPPESELRFNPIILQRAVAEGPAASAGCAAGGFGELSMLGVLFAGSSLLRRRRAR